MPSQPIKFIVKLFVDHNTLYMNYARNEKAESLRSACLSKLDNTVNNNSSFNGKYGEFFKWKCSFISKLELYIQPPLESPPKSFLYFSHFHKIICKTRTNTPFLYTSAIFYLSIISYIATIYSKNSFSASTI